MALINDIREMFPALSEKVYGKPLVYFDNAATSQRPKTVIDEWVEGSVRHNANIHRAVHKISVEATDAYERAREDVRRFINAAGREEVVFTSGTTASINLVANSFGEAFVKEGDEIIVTEAEHHSNIVPWQLMCQRRGAVLKVLPVDDEGHLKVELLEGMITGRTRIMAVTHISNVLGLVNPVKEIIDICHGHNVPVLVDGAQGIVHEEVDVKDLDCDFYVFSGHKMYAATGTGVLYGKKQLLDAMPPFMAGGEMVGTVRFSGTTFADLPLKFEAGTQNFTSAMTFSPAIECMKAMRVDQVRRYEDEVSDYLLDKLLSNNKIHLFGLPDSRHRKIGLFSFVMEGVHHEDLALVLDKMGVAVRSGQMCAEPLMDRFGVTGMLRVSLAPYNTMEEAEYFVRSLDRAIAMFE